MTTTTELDVRTTGPRRRLFSSIWHAMDDAVDEQIQMPKDELLVGLPERLIEIGPGKGSNFSRYAPGTSVIAIEPNTYFHPALTEQAAALGLDLTIYAADLRQLRLPGGSHDLVVSTLTVCSVPDRAGLLAEIHRVLRPGGRFVFVEHVAEPRGRRRLFQHLVRPTWRLLFDDCDPRADTDALIADLPFTTSETTTRNLGPSIDPTNLTHWGVAVK